MLDNITECVKAKVKYMSDTLKAVFLEFADGKFKWVPTSIIRNEFRHDEIELEQEFQIDYWFVKRYDLPRW